MIPLDPSPAEQDCRVKQTASRCCLEKTTINGDILLLARRLKAANPDALHPGKAGE
jgi:hypothetical protein